MTAKVWAVIPAAGSGLRMNQNLPKQYLPLGGKTVIENTLSLILGEVQIAQTVVCVAADDQHWQLKPIFNNVNTTLGCVTRSQSVLNGIMSFIDQADDNDWLLVHDAARPCLSPALLSSFIEQLKNHDVGGILALSSNDTVKLSTTSDGVSNVQETLDRDRIWYAQTPQMFRYGLLKSALQSAIDKQLNITDEASAMELSGYQPKLIEGEVSNLKITKPDDLLMAESIFASRR